MKRQCIYGAGDLGRIYMEFAQLNGFKAKGYVISNERDKPQDLDKPVYKVGELSEQPNEVAFVAACDWRSFPQIKRSLDEYGYYKVL